MQSPEIAASALVAMFPAKIPCGGGQVIGQRPTQRLENEEKPSLLWRAARQSSILCPREETVSRNRCGQGEEDAGTETGTGLQDPAGCLSSEPLHGTVQSVVRGMKGVATPPLLPFLSLEGTMNHYFVCFVPTFPSLFNDYTSF